MNSLPLLDVETMICTGKKFYVISENVLYTSVDGKNWSSQTLTNTFSKMLFHINDSVFALMQKDGKDVIAKLKKDGVSWEEFDCPINFPTEGFTYI